MSYRSAYASGDIDDKFQSPASSNTVANKSAFSFWRTNFWVLQTVTAGNGISEIDVVLSLKVTTTGCRFHFDQMLSIENVQKITDKMNANAHQTLKTRRSYIMFVIILRSSRNLPFKPMAFLFRKVSHTVYRWIWTKIFEIFTIFLLLFRKKQCNSLKF